MPSSCDQERVRVLVYTQVISEGYTRSQVGGWDLALHCVSFVLLLCANIRVCVCVPGSLADHKPTENCFFKKVQL